MDTITSSGASQGASPLSLHQCTLPGVSQADLVVPELLAPPKKKKEKSKEKPLVVLDAPFVGVEPEAKQALIEGATWTEFLGEWNDAPYVKNIVRYQQSDLQKEIFKDEYCNNFRYPMVMFAVIRDPATGKLDSVGGASASGFDLKDSGKFFKKDTVLFYADVRAFSTHARMTEIVAQKIEANWACGGSVRLYGLRQSVNGCALDSLQEILGDMRSSTEPPHEIEVFVDNPPSRSGGDDYDIDVMSDEYSCENINATLAYDWLFTDCLVRREIGVIAAPGATGKGFFSLQMAVALGAGLPIFGVWSTPAPGRVLYASCEDSEETMHNRLYYVLEQLPNDDAKRLAKKNVRRVPLNGDWSMFHNIGGKVKPTLALASLERMIKAFRPDLVILDTLSHLAGVEENANVEMTAVMNGFRSLAVEHDVTILLNHHTAKLRMGNGKPSAQEYLDASLHESLIRGASSIPNSIRWAMMLSPIRDIYVSNLFGGNTGNKRFVAMKVPKKNGGNPSDTYFFEREQHGILHRVEPTGLLAKQESKSGDVDLLVAEVDRRVESGEVPLSVSRCGEPLGWGRGDRGPRAANIAINLGLLVEQKKEKGNGRVLVPMSQ